MILIFVLSSLFILTAGHNDNFIKDAEEEAALMPQELNPAFVSDKDEPWRAIVPIQRIRRQLTDLEPSTPVDLPPTALAQVKYYSRVVAGVILGIAALVEVVVYIIETYWK